MKVTFLGATATVTGSKYLVESKGQRVLVDCGLFQGFKQLRLRNWSQQPFDPAALDAVVLTHAHLDHSGYVPLLVRNGYRGPVYATAATKDLCRIMLPDSGHLQEEEAEYANRKGYSRHRPALPLYTEDEARASLKWLEACPFDEDVDLGRELALRFHRAGHILGAASVQLANGDGSILFSGDVGRPHDPIVGGPDDRHDADFLVVESTYGDRRHDPEDPEAELERILRRVLARKGSVVIPAFALGRAQLVLYYLYRLREHGRIPAVPVFLDSPMAVGVTELFCNHETLLSPDEARRVCGVADYVGSIEESKALDRRKDPVIIVSASGMATGGRVLHHIKALGPDPKNAIVFVGYQAGGTRGAALTHGADSVKIHGEYVSIRAEVTNLGNLSAHADQQELVDWTASFKRPPRRTFVTHGEPRAADALRQRLERELGHEVTLPEYRETIDLHPGTESRTS